MPVKQPRGLRRPKLTREVIVKELAKEGYKLHTKTYMGAKQTLTVECKNGHKFVTCWNNFGTHGNRCKKCYCASRESKGKRRLLVRDRLYCISEAARILRVTEYDLRKNIAMGSIPRPSNIFGQKLYYSLTEIEIIEAMIEECV